MLIIRIHDDGTGTMSIGNYDVSVSVNREDIWRGRVEGRQRANGWDDLLVQVINAYRGSTSRNKHVTY